VTRSHPPGKARNAPAQPLGTGEAGAKRRRQKIYEVEIRQAGEKELNKMEHINKFSKAVFNENNHVMQQETRELQLIADGCRRLIQNNIIGYNYG
jgi:Tn3 transposase DDE domain